MYDLTEAEVLALTDAETERLVDIACAEAGVPLLPPRPDDVELLPVDQPDALAWQVSGIDGAFTDKDEANAALSALTSFTSRVNLSSSYGKEPRRITELPSYNVTPELTEHAAWSQEGYDANREALETNKRRQNEYDASMREYRSAVEKRNEAGKKVYDYLSEVKETAARKALLTEQLARYEELADGDTNIALRFLHTANEDAQDLGFPLPAETADDAS
jgi:hypothetical protein